MLHLEDLANEWLLDLLEYYVAPNDVLNGFLNLNSRLNSLIHQIRFKIDLSSAIRTNTGREVLSLLPCLTASSSLHQIYHLILSDDSFQNQTTIFSRIVDLRSLINLRSLVLLRPRANDLIEAFVEKLPFLLHLQTFSIEIPSDNDYSYIVDCIYRIFSNIPTALTKCIIHFDFLSLAVYDTAVTTSPHSILSNLKYLSICLYSLDDLLQLINYIRQIEYLDVELLQSKGIDHTTTIIANNIPSLLPNLNYFKLTMAGISFDHIQLLFQNHLSLTYLSLTSYYRLSREYLNADRWEKVIQSLPNLKQFHLSKCT
ncbi:unnamed protein product [Didymodactylos carnosus]|uniref:Uncharacterized protein n=1 Tax=Didymodactylos carnosus TaxID=1234261 RepID=A0A815L161_9BILA|nr:unnamed protein product [Didymodactylos carnosus]CAF4292288.1 unnamed protein product [Didymodactylos carnosus]